MAASFYAGGGRGGARMNGGRYRPISEINVTPLVAVTLCDVVAAPPRLSFTVATAVKVPLRV